MIKLSSFEIEARDLTINDLLAEIEAEENGSCPARVWCLTKRLKISKHAMPSFHCAFEQHHALWQCPESSDGHERILDRGDVTAVCTGAAFCGKASCHHARPHRWDPAAGCHAVFCRRLAEMAWDEEMRGERPDPIVSCMGKQNG